MENHPILISQSETPCNHAMFLLLQLVQVLQQRLVKWRRMNIMEKDEHHGEG